MSKNIGIISSIIIGAFAYIINNELIDYEIRIGASTLALIFGALFAISTTNVEEGGK